MSQSNLRVAFDRGTHIGFYEPIYGKAITLLSFVDHKYVRRFLENCNLGPWADNGAALLIKALSLWHRCGCASLITFHSVQTILRKKTLVRNRNTRTKRHDNSHRASRRWSNASFSLIPHPTLCLDGNKVRGTSGDIFTEGYHLSLSADINSLFAGWTTARIKRAVNGPPRACVSFALSCFSWLFVRGV